MLDSFVLTSGALLLWPAAWLQSHTLRCLWCDAI